MQEVIKKYEEMVKTINDKKNEKKYSEKTIIQVGSATCENAAGAQDVYREFEKHIESSGRNDIILKHVGCTGRCSREPIVGVISPNKMAVKYELVDAEKVHKIFIEHVLNGNIVQDCLLGSGESLAKNYQIFFCQGRNCGACKEASALFDYCQEKVNALTDKKVEVLKTHCFGACTVNDRKGRVSVLVRPSNVAYSVSSKEDIDLLIKEQIQGGKVVESLEIKRDPIDYKFLELYGDLEFFSKQSRIALRNAGIVDPESLDEYVEFNGFSSLAKVLDGADPQAVIDKITESKLRGRGGGGFPTGRKWQFGKDAKGDIKYIICNADEGDPGAFMDRSMLESDPFSIVEGMIIGGYCMGANKGFLYIRAEYPMAIDRIDNAIKKCREAGLLGKNILNSGFDFDLEIRLGAGAFVCGEETALINSIEGKRGQPRLRPPFPANKGLWGRPTVINNVETWANIPAILQFGPTWFANIGIEKSGGTKVFALAGKVNHTGLVEVPMGTTLRDIVYGIGGGIPNGKKLKAIQTGGPAGGCIPIDLIDTPVDYDSLMKLGSIMGSGGMIVMDETDCMVDIAKFFLTFIQDESCGKCTPCREGTKRMLEILEKITDGRGTEEDLEKLERLAHLVQKASVCGLGKAAPNPVLSTLKHFKDEYLAHVRDKKCPAGKCKKLITYSISDKCKGCTACARQCPVNAISGTPKGQHTIDPKVCIKCGRCFDVCKFGAVNKN